MAAAAPCVAIHGAALNSPQRRLFYDEGQPYHDVPMRMLSRAVPIGQQRQSGRAIGSEAHYVLSAFAVAVISRHAFRRDASEKYGVFIGRSSGVARVKSKRIARKAEEFLSDEEIQVQLSKKTDTIADENRWGHLLKELRPRLGVLLKDHLTRAAKDGKLEKAKFVRGDRVQHRKGSLGTVISVDVEGDPKVKQDGKLDAITQNGREFKIIGKAFIKSARVALFYDKRMDQHKNPDTKSVVNLEQPARTSYAMNQMELEGMAQKCMKLPCRPAMRSELLLKHDAAHVDTILKLKDLNEREAAKEADAYRGVYLCPGSSQASLLAAGSVCEATSRVCAGEVRAATCIVRPPGHHAQKEGAMGFCIFGNVAIAAAEARRRSWAEKVLIVDWDVHHGNGTQRMFVDDDTVMYCSVHRHDEGKYYPGGDKQDPTFVGTGKGEGYSVNVGFDALGAKIAGIPPPGDAEWSLAFEKIIMPIARKFDPDVVIVNAGFDAASGDPIGGCECTQFVYYRITRMLRSLAEGRVVLALEGGHHMEMLSKGIMASTAALLGDQMRDFPEENWPGEAHDFHKKAIDKSYEVLKKYWDI